MKLLDWGRGIGMGKWASLRVMGLTRGQTSRMLKTLLPRTRPSWIEGLILTNGLLKESWSGPSQLHNIKCSSFYPGWPQSSPCVIIWSSSVSFYNSWLCLLLYPMSVSEWFSHAFIFSPYYEFALTACYPLLWKQIYTQVCIVLFLCDQVQLAWSLWFLMLHRAH